MGKRNKRKQSEKVLHNLICVYEANHEIGDDDTTSLKSSPPIYIQQMFFKLLQEFKSEWRHFVILSEYDKLGDSLKDKMIAFVDDEKEAAITLAPFLNSLCRPQRIVFLKEYIWVLPGEQLIELKCGGLGHIVDSEEEFLYKLEGGGSVALRFYVKRAPSGLSTAQFGIKIKKCSEKKVVGQMSVMVDELGWFGNEWSLDNLKESSHSGFFAFEDHRFEEVQSLTFRVALHLE